MVTCRADISFPILKLSLYNNSPAQCHLDAIKNVFQYLNATLTEGIMFRRPQPDKTLPRQYFNRLMTQHIKSSYRPKIRIPTLHMAILIPIGQTIVPTADPSVVLLAGGLIVNRTILQSKVALSSTKAEFYALTETGKWVIYIRMVLHDLGIQQTSATTIYEDNKGCLQMTQTLKSTKWTWHVETRYFAILHWVQTDQLQISKIDTSDNTSDVLTKATGRLLFYRHNATPMGHRKPQYVTDTHDWKIWGENLWRNHSFIFFKLCSYILQFCLCSTYIFFSTFI